MPTLASSSKIRLRVLSDLHLNFGGGGVPSCPADIVLLAGDIHTASAVIPVVAKEFPRKKVVFVPGNHEYYGYSLDSAQAVMRGDAASYRNIHFLDNDRVDFTIRGSTIRILGATLWTDFACFNGSPQGIEFAKSKARAHVNDFRMIRNKDYSNFTPDHAIALHVESVAWLDREIARAREDNVICVVVTHHAPSLQSSAPQYADDPVTAAFCSSIENIAGRACLWVHGHTHNSADYRLPGGCRVVANPRGYTRGKTCENTDFDPMLTLILDTK